jgi:hypothetical protein
MMGHVDFYVINARALPVLGPLLQRWLSDGRLIGRESIALNPKRPDRALGSFRINVATEVER